MEVMLRLERETLAPYAALGNIISMNSYDALPLPWTIGTPVTAFPESQFVRRIYDREGVLTNGQTFFGGGSVHTLEQEEHGLGTASMVTRWREENPELAGTDKDVVKLHIKDLREALGGQESLVVGSGIAILLFKKEAST
jgi:hypothetical protein